MTRAFRKSYSPTSPAPHAAGREAPGGGPTPPRAREPQSPVRAQPTHVPRSGIGSPRASGVGRPVRVTTSGSAVPNLGLQDPRAPGFRVQNLGTTLSASSSPRPNFGDPPRRPDSWTLGTLCPLPCPGPEFRGPFAPSQVWNFGGTFARLPRGWARNFGKLAHCPLPTRATELRAPEPPQDRAPRGSPDRPPPPHPELRGSPRPPPALELRGPPRQHAVSAGEAHPAGWAPRECPAESGAARGADSPRPPRRPRLCLRCRCRLRRLRSHRIGSRRSRRPPRRPASPLPAPPRPRGLPQLPLPALRGGAGRGGGRRSGEPGAMGRGLGGRGVRVVKGAGVRERH